MLRLEIPQKGEILQRRQTPIPMIKLSLFAQITSTLLREMFGNIVRKHGTDKYSIDINSWTHIASKLFCHPENVMV